MVASVRAQGEGDAFSATDAVRTVPLFAVTPMESASPLCALEALP